MKFVHFVAIQASSWHTICGSLRKLSSLFFSFFVRRNWSHIATYLVVIVLVVLFGKLWKLSYREGERAMRPVWVPWKFSRVSDYVHGYFSRRNFLWAFVSIDPINVRTKFEVRSFTPITRSWDNRPHPKIQKLRSPWTRPRSLFSSKIFNTLSFRLTL